MLNLVLYKLPGNIFQSCSILKQKCFPTKVDPVECSSCQPAYVQGAISATTSLGDRSAHHSRAIYFYLEQIA